MTAERLAELRAICAEAVHTTGYGTRLPRAKNRAAMVRAAMALPEALDALDSPRVKAAIELAEIIRATPVGSYRPLPAEAKKALGRFVAADLYDRAHGKGAGDVPK